MQRQVRCWKRIQVEVTVVPSQRGGDRRLRNIAGILRVTGAGVDRAEVERWATVLGYLDIWHQAINFTDRRETLEKV